MAGARCALRFGAYLSFTNEKKISMRERTSMKNWVDGGRLIDEWKLVDEERLVDEENFDEMAGKTTRPSLPISH
eukprot:6177204-Pleurochrysis_carterae.AAC.2